MNSGQRISGKVTRSENAYLTVYLSLTLAVLLSLCLTLIEGARKNAVYMEAECVTDIGLNSIFAEYHRELLKRYNLFAIDSAYGGDQPSADNTKEHLTEYLEKNFSSEDTFVAGQLHRDFLGMQLGEVQLGKVCLFTDEEGAVFRKRAAEALLDDLDIDKLEQLQDWMTTVDSEELLKRDIAAEKEKLDKKLNAYDGQEKQVSEEEWETVHVTNPTSDLENKRKAEALRFVVDDILSLSTKALDTDNLYTARKEAGKVNQGNCEVADASGLASLTERFLFQEYLIRYMSYYGRETEAEEADKHAADYQLEYLICGKKNDVDNLSGVVKRLTALREVSNVVYLHKDKEKYAVAKVLGYALALLMLIPEAGSLVTEILVFGWAYAESLYDVRCLLNGGKIPLMKSAETWHYGLETALGIGMPDKESKTEGMSYVDYLRVLLMVGEESVLTDRAFNLMEADIRLTPGNEDFRMDGCIDFLQATVEVESAYGYGCSVTRAKGYSTQ